MLKSELLVYKSIIMSISDKPKSVSRPKNYLYKEKIDKALLERCNNKEIKPKIYKKNFRKIGDKYEY